MYKLSYRKKGTNSQQDFASDPRDVISSIEKFLETDSDSLLPQETAALIKTALDASNSKLTIRIDKLKVTITPVSTEVISAKDLANNPSKQSATLIGELGGRSQITGEVYFSLVHNGSVAFETEHGTIYYEDDYELLVCYAD